jgi:predicted ATPase
MIKHVRITNFRCLGDVSVDLDPVTVLIGRSGTGKTTFVDALEFLRDYIVTRGAVMNQYGGNLSRILSATAPRPLELRFVVRFDAPGAGADYEYLLVLAQHPQHVVQNPMQLPDFREEKLSLGEQVLFHQANNKWIHPPQVHSPPSAGGLALGGLTGFSEVTTAHLVLSTGLGWYAFPDTVLLGTSGPPTIPQEETGLSDHGRNYLRAFTALTLNLQTWSYKKEMVAALRKLNPSVSSVELRMPDRGDILVGHNVAGKILTFRLAEESEGFRRFLAHLIALYQVPSKQTLIFEEPEKGLHPGAFAVLAEQMRACPEDGRGQIVLTTHSPELLDLFQPENIRVVEMDNYTTKIGPMAPEQVEAVRENLLRPGELLTVDPARIAEAAPSKE